MGIAENDRRLREEIPDNVTIVLACKTRTVEEVLEAMEAGATDIGQNYVQEGAATVETLGNRARNSYQVAMEEGSNMVRIGTAVFGERACQLARRE